MARMHPAAVPDHTPSAAERRLFSRIRDETPDDWHALHSLGLRTHARKPWAEADFVLITDAGVWVIEVKGGRIARRDRTWYTNEHPLRESPFQQAAGAAAALHHDLRDGVPQGRDCFVGYGVAFPDVRFDEEGPDIDPALVYDADDLAAPFERYAERLVEHWRGRIGRPLRQLSPRTRREILDRTAGDFDLIPSLRAELDEVERELVRLTEQQRTAVDGLLLTPRVIVTGGAGTGKTTLAVHEAQRQASQGRGTLLCCHTRRLAAELRRGVGDRSRLEVTHYHGLLSTLIARAELREAVPDAERHDLFDVFYPAVAIDAMDLLAEPRYECLVVDEAQDLLLAAHLEVFDRLLEGGLEAGWWRTFLDPFQDVHGAAGAPARRRLEEAADANYRLAINCRNTEPIATQTALLSGRALEETLATTGPAVEHHWYTDRRKMRQEIGRCLRRLLDGGLRADEIVVLSPHQRGHSSLAEGLPSGVPAALWEGGSGGSRPERSIEFSTVAGFKGLEAPAVLVIDIDDLGGRHSRMALYVATSRPRAYLIVFIAAELRERYEQEAVEFGRRIALKLNERAPAGVTAASADD